jgi:hypothetical protein
MDYPATLLPLNEQPLVLPRGNTVRILHSTLTLIPSRGEAARAPAGRTVLDPRGHPAPAEQVILRMCESDGWRGASMEDFGRKFRTSAGAPASLPVEHQALLARIFSRTVSRLGFFNLILWKGDHLLFAAATSGLHERLRAPQLRWVDAAIAEGFPPHALVMIRWRRNDAKG